VVLSLLVDNALYSSELRAVVDLSSNFQVYYGYFGVEEKVVYEDTGLVK